MFHLEFLKFSRTVPKLFKSLSYTVLEQLFKNYARIILELFWQGKSQLICCLLITFAISLKMDPDQDPHFVRPDLILNHLNLLIIVFLKELFEKVNFEKSQQMTTKACKTT